MKQLQIGCLLLLSGLVQAQLINFPGRIDTSARMPNRYQVGFLNKVVYFIPPVGLDPGAVPLVTGKLPVPGAYMVMSGTDLGSQLLSADQAIYKSVTGLQSFSQFAAYVQPTAIYDGDVWTKTTGVTTTSTPGYGYVVTASVNGSYYLRNIRGAANVKMFGAKGDSTTNDSPAIAAAIAYVKTVKPGSYLTKTVFFPSGYYMMLSDLNATDTYSICLVGEGNRSGGTVLIGNTGNIAVDVSGSTRAHIRDLSISVANGLSNPSKIGIQFALNKNAPNQATAGTQRAGLNCILSNVSVLMGDFSGVTGTSAGWNGGLGAIALVNCRSEEFAAQNVTLQANTPAVFTMTRTLSSYTSYSYTVSSNYTPIQDDANGSMGVTNWSGQNSLFGWEHETPGMLLCGVNGFNFHGYQGRLNNANGGSYETAVRMVNYCTGVNLSGTTESYSQLLSLQNTVENLVYNVSTANITAGTTVPVFYLDQGAALVHPSIAVWFGNPPEMGTTRYFLYTPDVNGGNSPTTSKITNGEITCSAWASNPLFITGNLLKQTGNTRFSTGQPFEKSGPYVRDLKSYDKPLGTVQSGNAAVVASLIHFTKADKATTGSGNGGYYTFHVKGALRLGGINTANGPSIVQFDGTYTVGVDGANTTNTGQVATNGTIAILNKATWNAGYLDVSGLALSIDLSGTPSLNLTINTSGSGAGEPISAQYQVEQISNFAVKSSVISD